MQRLPDIVRLTKCALGIILIVSFFLPWVAQTPSCLDRSVVIRDNISGLALAEEGTAPEALLELARKHPTDRAACLAARCVQCVGGEIDTVAHRIRTCFRKSCATFRLRPYQADSPPRSAPHLDIPEPTWETPPQGERE